MLPDRMENHWWWRPGWRPGRPFYAWHITFPQQPEVAHLAAIYGNVLVGVPNVTPVPADSLHLTLQGIGFADEVSATELDEIVRAAERRCAAVERVRCRLGPAGIFSEAVYLQVQPADELAALQSVLVDALSEVLPESRVPRDDYDFVPHVSIAYAMSDGPVDPVALAVGTMDRGATVDIGTVSLIALRREQGSYAWDDVTAVPLAGRSPQGR